MKSLCWSLAHKICDVLNQLEGVDLVTQYRSKYFVSMSRCFTK